MESPINRTDDLDSLDELVQSHLDSLSRKLKTRHTVEEIQAEIIAINDLLQSYELREELLEKLAESSAPTEQRVLMVEALRRQSERLRERAAEVRIRAQQTQEQSEAIRLRGKALIAKAEDTVKRALKYI